MELWSQCGTPGADWARSATSWALCWMELSEPDPILSRRRMCINGLNARLTHFQVTQNSLISGANRGSLGSAQIPSPFGGQKRFSCTLARGYWEHGSGSLRHRYRRSPADTEVSLDSEAPSPPPRSRG